jgi:hypothetical protein
MFGCVATMLEGMAIALCFAAVHPASTIQHRGRLAWRSFPRKGMAPRAQVHGQFAAIWFTPAGNTI